MPISNAKNVAFTEKAEAFYAQFHRLKQQVINHWWVLLLTIALGLFIEMLVTMRLQSFYRSEGKIISSVKLTVNSGPISNTEANGDFFDTQVELMESPEVLRQAEAKLSATRPELTQSEVKIAVEQLSKTSIFTLSATGRDKVYTQALLDAVMDQYLQFLSDQKTKSSDSAMQGITSQMLEKETEISQMEDQILAWKKKNNLSSLQEEGNSAAKYVADLKQDLAKSQTNYELLDTLSLDQSLQRRQETLDTTTLARSIDPNSVSGAAAAYLQAKQEILLKQARREELSQYLKPKHPKIITLSEEITRLNNTIKILKDQSQQELATQRDSLRIQIDNIKKQIALWEVKAVELSGRIGEFENMNEKLTRMKGNYQQLEEAKSSMTIREKVEQEPMSIMARASEAEPIHQGLVKALVIGILGGLIVGIGILLLINQFDDRIRSFSEMQATFEHQIIGHVPKSDITSHPLLVENDDRHMLFESFRNIRSSIFFMPYEGSRPKTLLITSSIPHEGKSTVSSNFAVTLAMSGAKTLLIDADMRRGALHDIFKVPSSPGLTEILGGTATLKKTIRDTSVENLSFLPRGQGTLHANDLLLGKQTDALIKKVYAEYDYIVFDSAPVLAADDTSNLAPKVDGTIFVVRASFTQARLARRTLELLADRQVNILGLIFNYAETSAADYPYYRYEEYHKQPVS